MYVPWCNCWVCGAYAVNSPFDDLTVYSNLSGRPVTVCLDCNDYLWRNGFMDPEGRPPLASVGTTPRPSSQRSADAPPSSTENHPPR
jgi:hypothetical protein